MTKIADTRQREGETWAEYDERINMPWRQVRREFMARDDWEPVYEPWRHGGSYVSNIVYPSGAVGCIVSARHSATGRFHVACGPAELTEVKHKTRRAAAFAERAYALQLWGEHDASRAAL